MDELEYKTLRYNVMKKYMALLDFTDKEHAIFLSGDWDEAMILKHREEANYEQLKNDFWQSVEDWKKLLENTEITKENYQFIKFSKAVLGQFEDNKDEIHDIIFKELHRLVESKSPAEQIKNYVSPEVIKQKMIGLVAKL